MEAGAEPCGTAFSGLMEAMPFDKLMLSSRGRAWPAPSARGGCEEKMERLCFLSSASPSDSVSIRPYDDLRQTLGAGDQGATCLRERYAGPV